MNNKILISTSLLLIILVLVSCSLWGAIFPGYMVDVTGWIHDSKDSSKLKSVTIIRITDYAGIPLPTPDSTNSNIFGGYEFSLGEPDTGNWENDSVTNINLQIQYNKEGYTPLDTTFYSLEVEFVNYADGIHLWDLKFPDIFLDKIDTLQ